jgi:RNA-directed DNA polymerase
VLLKKVAQRVEDADVLHLLRLMLKAAGRRGVSQGGVISPLLSNIYLNEVDKMLEKAKEVTKYKGWTEIEYARCADDLVVLVDFRPRREWLRHVVERRIREEWAKLQVEVNEERSRTVDLREGTSFGFLGFDFRRVRSRAGKWRADRAATEAEGCLPPLPFTRGPGADPRDQPHPAWPGKGPAAPRLRLETVE